MSPGMHTEEAFEIAVEGELLSRGWDRGPRLYDAELGLATAELWEFICYPFGREVAAKLKISRFWEYFGRLTWV